MDQCARAGLQAKSYCRQIFGPVQEFCELLCRCSLVADKGPRCLPNIDSGIVLRLNLRFWRRVFLQGNTPSSRGCRA